MKIPIFPVKYHQNGEFSMAMLVYRRVAQKFAQIGFLKETVSIGSTVPALPTSLDQNYPGCILSFVRDGVEPLRMSCWQQIISNHRKDEEIFAELQHSGLKDLFVRLSKTNEHDKM